MERSRKPKVVNTDRLMMYHGREDVLFSVDVKPKEEEVQWKNAPIRSNNVLPPGVFTVAWEMFYNYAGNF